MTAEDLIGIWKLLTCYSQNAEGGRSYYFGEDATGRLTYLDNGLMSVLVQRRGRRKFAGDLGQGTPEEIKEAFDGFDAYCGSYSLDLNAGIVTHHVEIARHPNYVGSDQVRYFTLSGGLLSIRTAPFRLDGEEVVFYLDWQKQV